MGNDARIDLVVEDRSDNLDRDRIGYPKTSEKLGGQTLLFHPRIDGLASSVNEDNPDTDCIQEGHVIQEEIHLISRFHGAAAILDQKNPSAELLKVWQRLDKDFRTLA